MDFSQIRGGVVFGMDIDALEQQREDEAPFREEGRAFLASKAVKLSRTDMVALVEGVLTEAVNQLVNRHDVDEGEALGLLNHVLSDAYHESSVFAPPQED